MLMVGGLVAFGIIPASGAGALVSQNPLCPVFGEPKTDGRIFFMEGIQPFFIVFHTAPIPAEIMVVGFHVCNSVQWAVHGKHADMCHGSQTVRVKLFYKAV